MTMTMTLNFEYADTQFVIEDAHIEDGCIEDFDSVYVVGGETLPSGQRQKAPMGMDCFWLLFDSDEKLQKIVQDEIWKEFPDSTDCNGSDPTGRNYGVRVI